MWHVPCHEILFNGNSFPFQFVRHGHSKSANTYTQYRVHRYTQQYRSIIMIIFFFALLMIIIYFVVCASWILILCSKHIYIHVEMASGRLAHHRIAVVSHERRCLSRYITPIGEGFDGKHKIYVCYRPMRKNGRWLTVATQHEQTPSRYQN